MAAATIICNVALSAVFSRCFNLLFGGPSPSQQNLTQTLQTFLNTLTHNFGLVVDQAIKDAYLDHSFDQIKVDTLTAMSLIRDYSYSLDTTTLNDALYAITQAASRFQVIFDKTYKETFQDPLPTHLVKSPGFPDRVAQYQAFVKTQEKIKKTFYVLKAVACFDLLITAKKAELIPTLAPALANRVTQYVDYANKIKDIEYRWLILVINSIDPDSFFRGPNNSLVVSATYFGDRQVTGAFTPVVDGNRTTMTGTLSLTFVQSGLSESVPMSIAKPRNQQQTSRVVGESMRQYIEKRITEVVQDEYVKAGSPLKGEIQQATALWKEVLTPPSI